MIYEGERLDDLQLKGLKIIQNPKLFCFGTDAVLLANYVKVRTNGKVVDLGTGTGIIPLIIWAKTKANEIIGLEIQKEMSDMALRSIKLNGLEDRIKIINGDLKNISSYFKGQAYDNVTCNPPYMKKDSGFINKGDSVTMARHEIMCTLEDVIKSAEYLLKHKGVLSMVHRPERLADVIALMRKYKIEPKTIRFIQNMSDEAPVLFLISGMKGTNPSLKFEAPLIIKNRDGTYSDEIETIYERLNKVDLNALSGCDSNRKS